MSLIRHRRTLPLLALALSLGCGDPASAPVESAAPEVEVVRASDGDWFIDRAAASGLDFVHANGMSGEFYFAEMMGSGAALFDYDNDGDLDLFLVQSGSFGPASSAGDGQSGDRLYRNDLETKGDGTVELRFTEVTDASGIQGLDYGMGVAAADYDGDGFVDLYVTAFGANRLWRNRGDGTFEEVTQAAGVRDPRWSVPALFFDYDGDNDLDLFVGNYVDFALTTHKRCTTDRGEPNYCGPLAYRPQADALFENRGDGTFAEVSDKAGIGGARGGALGAVSADFNGDGRLDLYVANDGTANALWINQGDGRFRNESLLAGTAVNADGAPEASMGIDAADFDGDGDEDLFMTHLSHETNTLFVNQGDGLFDDRSTKLGLGLASWQATGFGTAWFDYDNDGWLDLLAVNGAVRVIESLARAGDPFPLHQPNSLFHNQAGRGFEDVSDRAGAVFALSEVSRGAAFGDIDNDGDTDVVISNNHGPVRLLVNQIGQRTPWLGLRLTDNTGRLDRLGAWVGLAGPGLERPLWRRVRSAASYASANDPRLLFGLGTGDSSGSYQARVRWPDGCEELFTELAAGRYTTLRQGSGVAAPEVWP